MIALRFIKHDIDETSFPFNPIAKTSLHDYGVKQIANSLRHNQHLQELYIGKDLECNSRACPFI
jgi:hypothetical protein